MSGETSRIPLLNQYYQQYLVGQETAGFIKKVTKRYSIGSLERLAVSSRRETRRAAILALGLVADYESNAVVGRALIDDDRGVRSLAENAILQLWRRAGSEVQRQRLAALFRMNSSQQFKECLVKAGELLQEAPWFAEVWNQRAIAHYSLGQFRESIRDCHQALELNPYHFGAASGMGQCHLQLNDYASALECFRRALKLNPSLEGVRASVAYLERSLKGKK